MEVKVFVDEEKGSLIGQPEEWCKTVQELGLKGQAEAFAGKEQVAGDASVLPFPRMTNEMVQVFGLYLPDHDDITGYRGDPIPMKALGAYGLCTKEGLVGEGLFNKVEIWHAFGKPDPIMVFLKKSSQYGTDGHYLMAQWGPEIVTFDKMKESVLKDLCTEAKAKAKEALATLKALADSPDDTFLEMAMTKLKNGNARLLESVYI